MNKQTSFLLNNEGMSVWKSNQPIINICECVDGKPGELLYTAEWRIAKSLFMQIINPFGEATISLSFKNKAGAELYTGSFMSYKKKYRNLTDTQGMQLYDITFRTEWLQNVSCELSQKGRQILLWKNNNKGGGTIFRNDTPVAEITTTLNGIINYKRLDLLTDTGTTLLLAFAAVIYSY